MKRNNNVCCPTCGFIIFKTKEKTNEQMLLKTYLFERNYPKPLMYSGKLFCPECGCELKYFNHNLV